MDFRCRHTKRKGGLLYAVARKSVPNAGKGLHIKVSNRESSAYIKLRRFGYSINHIAKAFGRSTSVVHKRIARAKTYIASLSNRGYRKFTFSDLFYDKRKMPNSDRLTSVGPRLRMMKKYLPGWLTWILGESDKPP